MFNLPFHLVLYWEVHKARCAGSQTGGRALLGFFVDELVEGDVGVPLDPVEVRVVVLLDGLVGPSERTKAGGHVRSGPAPFQCPNDEHRVSEEE